MPRLAFARRLARKYFTTPCEVLAETETTDNEGMPQTTYAHKAYTRCKLDAQTFFAGVQVEQPGGLRGPLINLTNLWVELPIDPADPTRISQTDSTYAVLASPGFLLAATDRLVAMGTTLLIRGIRGPKTLEVARYIDVVHLGEPGT